MPMNKLVSTPLGDAWDPAEFFDFAKMQVPMPCNLLEIKIGKNYHNLSLHESQAIIEDDWDDTKGEWLDA
jgi:hypothetical protein